MPTATRQCRMCKSRQRVETMTAINGAFYCNMEHALAYAQEKGRKALDRLRQKAARKQKEAFRADDKPHQLELTRRRFNEFIRALDKGSNCPTCGDPLVPGMYDAGHVRTVASCPALRFDPRNCFGQCRSCNGSGTIRRKTRKTQESVSQIYKEWVLNTKGQEFHDWLFGPHEAKHWTCDDLREIRKVVSAETRRLEKGLPPSKDWRALPDNRRAV